MKTIKELDLEVVVEYNRISGQDCRKEAIIFLTVGFEIFGRKATREMTDRIREYNLVTADELLEDLEKILSS